MPGFYDGTANQTIVYVNPTDQVLTIGDTGLQEIHMQGFVTIEPSDFVFAPETWHWWPPPSQTISDGRHRRTTMRLSSQ